MQDPIAIDDSLVLDYVNIQQVLAKQLEDGSVGYMLEHKTFPEYTLREYRAMAEKYGQKYKDFDVQQMEDEYWIKLKQQSQSWEPYIPRYSIDNSYSVFCPDTKIWHLANFTGEESEIHQVNFYLFYTIILMSLACYFFSNRIHEKLILNVILIIILGWNTTIRWNPKTICLLRLSIFRISISSRGWQPVCD